MQTQICMVLAFTVISPYMGTDGWLFTLADQFLGMDVNPLYDLQHAKDLYLHANPAYSSYFMVPML